MQVVFSVVLHHQTNQGLVAPGVRSFFFVRSRRAAGEGIEARGGGLRAPGRQVGVAVGEGHPDGALLPGKGRFPDG